MRRILCIWFPNWPVQRLLAAQPEFRGRPIFLHASWGNRGERVIACSREAYARGARIGMPLAEATSLWQGAGRGRNELLPKAGADCVVSGSSALPVHVTPHDSLADERGLVQLAEWCERFSPLVGVAGDGDSSAAESSTTSRRGSDSLLLDVTGLGAWFGGEEFLAEQVVADLHRLGYSVQMALADTIGAAWAVSRYGFWISAGRVEGGEESLASRHPPVGAGGSSRQRSSSEVSPRQSASLSASYVLVSPGDQLPALRCLPVEALRLSVESVAVLRQLGIHAIQQLLDVPRASLASRLGAEVLQRLDQATGAVEEVLVTQRPAPTFHAQRQLEYPTERREAIEFVLQQLMEGVVQRLAERGQGVLQLATTLEVLPVAKSRARELLVAGGEPKRVDLRFDLFCPVAESRHLLELVKLRLEQVRLSGPVQRIDVRAVVTAPLKQGQASLFGEPSAGGRREFASLVDRLSGRLGRRCVLCPRLEAEAQPECASVLLSLSDGESRRSFGRGGTADWWGRSFFGPNDRPLQLQHPPLPLQVIAVVPAGPPVRFHEGNRSYPVSRYWGPERIETGWWRGPTVRRDYYRVETPTGDRFWIFRRLDDDRWFLHGVFL